MNVQRAASRSTLAARLLRMLRMMLTDKMHLGATFGKHSAVGNTLRIQCLPSLQTDMEDVMRIQVLYFASAREEIGKREEEITISTTDRYTLRDLRKLLCEKYPAADAAIGAITLARNLEYSTDDAELHDGDEVALIPPISGG